jgi:hypothetical protein
MVSKSRALAWIKLNLGLRKMCIANWGHLSRPAPSQNSWQRRLQIYERMVDDSQAFAKTMVRRKLVQKGENSREVKDYYPREVLVAWVWAPVEAPPRDLAAPRLLNK